MTCSPLHFLACEPRQGAPPMTSSWPPGAAVWGLATQPTPLNQVYLCLSSLQAWGRIVQKWYHNLRPEARSQSSY